MNSKFRRILFISVLTACWFILSAVYIYSISNPTVISDTFDKSVLNKTSSQELLKGEKIQGNFKATQNYLGQILIRFYNFDRINSDSVIFRFKEKDAEKWRYENVYKTDQFQPNQLFPFGFPTIPDSKGRQYAFEAESVSGKPEDAVTLSSLEPRVTASYQYPKKLIFKDPNVLIEFSVSKFSSIDFSQNLAISIVTYLTTVALFMMLIYLFLDYALEGGLKAFYRINSRRIILLGIALLFLASLLLYLKKPALSQNVSIVSYFILAFGVIYAILEAKRTKKEDL